jgi:predicted dehydrogenase
MVDRSSSRLNVLVCGAGSIGQRHIKNLISLGVKVSVWRERDELLDSVVEQFGVTPCYDLDQGIIEAEGIIVATATDRHLFIIKKALLAKKAIFIEKPLSHNWSGISDLLSLSKKYESVIEVGCFLRAHPGLQLMSQELATKRAGALLTFQLSVGQELDQWRPGSDYRQCYSADSSRGGGALMDLIHEIDLATWFGGTIKGLFADQRSIGGLELKADDLTNIIVELDSGATGQIQMDMISPVLRRRFEFVFEHEIYRWDYSLGSLIVESENGCRSVHQTAANFDRNDIFLNHMQHFLNRITNPVLAPYCSLIDGIHALDAALTARESAHTKRWTPLLYLQDYSE